MKISANLKTQVLNDQAIGISQAGKLYYGEASPRFVKFLSFISYIPLLKRAANQHLHKRGIKVIRAVNKSQVLTLIFKGTKPSEGWKPIKDQFIKTHQHVFSEKQIFYIRDLLELEKEIQSLQKKPANINFEREIAQLKSQPIDSSNSDQLIDQLHLLSLNVQIFKLNPFAFKRIHQSYSSRDQADHFISQLTQCQLLNLLPFLGSQLINTACFSVLSKEWAMLDSQRILKWRLITDIESFKTALTLVGKPSELAVDKDVFKEALVRHGKLKETEATFDDFVKEFPFLTQQDLNDEKLLISVAHIYRYYRSLAKSDSVKGKPDIKFLRTALFTIIRQEMSGQSSKKEALRRVSKALKSKKETVKGLVGVKTLKERIQKEAFRSYLRQTFHAYHNTQHLPLPVDLAEEFIALFDSSFILENLSAAIEKDIGKLIDVTCQEFHKTSHPFPLFLTMDALRQAIKSEEITHKKLKEIASHATSFEEQIQFVIAKQETDPSASIDVAEFINQMRDEPVTLGMRLILGGIKTFCSSKELKLLESQEKELFQMCHHFDKAILVQHDINTYLPVIPNLPVGLLKFNAQNVQEGLKPFFDLAIQFLEANIKLLQHGKGEEVSPLIKFMMEKHILKSIRKVKVESEEKGSILFNMNQFEIANAASPLIKLGIKALGPTVRICAPLVPLIVKIVLKWLPPVEEFKEFLDEKNKKAASTAVKPLVDALEIAIFKLLEHHDLMEYERFFEFLMKQLAVKGEMDEQELILQTLIVTVAFLKNLQKDSRCLEGMVNALLSKKESG